MKTLTTLFFAIAVLLSLSAFSPFDAPLETIHQNMVTTPTPTSTWQATLSANQTQNAAYAATQGAKLTQTALAPTATPTQTATRPAPTQTLVPTSTLASMTAMAQSAPHTYQNTPIPGIGEPITEKNLNEMELAAQWGRGTIVRVAYAPDGRFFFVGSQYGVAVYDVRDDRAPAWVAVQAFERMSVSEDGQFLRVENSSRAVIYHLSQRKIVEMTPAKIMWHDLVTSIEGDYGDLKVVSPDGKFEFSGNRTCVWVEEYGGCSSWETTYEKVTLLKTGEMLYERYDPVPLVTYSDYSSPLGCDLASFGYCGNAFIPLANSPHRAAFSPDGMIFAVLYRPSGLGGDERFSILRLYRTSDGKLLNAIGTYSHPVEDFAYAPDSKTLVVGFTDGSVQVWDVAQNELLQTAMHFDAPIAYVEYSVDSQYLVVKHTNTVDIRMTRDGSLRARLGATTFALSPVTNVLALADDEGHIRLLDLNTWQVLHNITAHADTILSLAFSPDGTVLASSGQDCALKMWEVKTGQFLHLNEQTVVDAYGEGYTASRIFIHHLEFVPGTHQLIGFGSWGTTVSWNTNSGATQYVLESAPLETYNGMVTLNPHFPEFFGVDQARALFYINEVGYHLEDGTLAGEYQPPTGLPQGCYAAGPVTNDGTLRFTRGYDAREGQICVLDNDTLDLVQLLTVLPPPQNWTDSALDWLYLSPDGEQLLVTTWNGVMYVFEIGG